MFALFSQERYYLFLQRTNKIS